MQKGDGHREGKNVLDPIVEHCVKTGVRALTVFAFSSENWNRPQYEVDLLMKLLEETIHEQIPRMKKFNIALRFIGSFPITFTFSCLNGRCRATNSTS